MLKECPSEEEQPKQSRTGLGWGEMWDLCEGYTLWLSYSLHNISKSLWCMDPCFRNVERDRGQRQGWCPDVVWSKMISQLQIGKHITLCARSEYDIDSQLQGKIQIWSSTERLLEIKLFSQFLTVRATALSGACLVLKKSVLCHWACFPSSKTKMHSGLGWTILWVWVVCWDAIRKHCE